MAQPSQQPRSGCPVSLGLDIFGDKWTLLIVRDLMFNGKRHYRELLHSAEGISSNILADRLKMLLAEGVITKADDPSHLQKVIYSLTEKGIALLPIVLAISEWSFEYRPVGEAYRQESSLPRTENSVGEGMQKLRREHLAQFANTT
ncbi:transcriptional regulator [Deinococcus psychrotolerans]|uniref:Transcriptional regulator n=1 Tax=Deinococcus psychrotolerans TaxID=2489213 RepID=A0A3G8YPL9_9DEIO|nr:helix-turn-helix domain-containing protein [Deinococcus psychrotolerans]AZI43581.1 transcriptional regulator [Deinococcus psychrotolerans]